MAKKISQSKLDLLNDYKATFESDEGKRVLKDLAKASGFWACSHVADDPYTTAFNEGARSIFLRIMETLKTKPENLLDINQEEEEF